MQLLRKVVLWQLSQYLHYWERAVNVFSDFSQQSPICTNINFPFLAQSFADSTAKDGVSVVFSRKTLIGVKTFEDFIKGDVYDGLRLRNLKTV
ncbi:MAG: hypothetical protein V7K85_06425 [Nostoc sp.]